MFEIVADDIARLNDEDLRTLGGLLCEAELRAHGLPVSAVPGAATRMRRMAESMGA
jgi:hypothetical protein